MEKILSAEDFISDYEEVSYLGGHVLIGDAIKAMRAFAKYHVLRAQEAASVQSRMKITSGWGTLKHRGTVDVSYKDTPLQHENYGHGDCTYSIIEPDRSIVFEAYPLTNIK